MQSSPLRVAKLLLLLILLFIYIQYICMGGMLSALHSIMLVITKIVFLCRWYIYTMKIKTTQHLETLPHEPTSKHTRAKKGSSVSQVYFAKIKYDVGRPFIDSMVSISLHTIPFLNRTLNYPAMQLVWYTSVCQIGTKSPMFLNKKVYPDLCYHNLNL